VLIQKKETFTVNYHLLMMHQVPILIIKPVLDDGDEDHLDKFIVFEILEELADIVDNTTILEPYVEEKTLNRN